MHFEIISDVWEICSVWELRSLSVCLSVCLEGHEVGKIPSSSVCLLHGEQLWVWGMMGAVRRVRGGVSRFLSQTLPSPGTFWVPWRPVGSGRTCQEAPAGPGSLASREATGGPPDPGHSPFLQAEQTEVKPRSGVFSETSWFFNMDGLKTCVSKARRWKLSPTRMTFPNFQNCPL